MLLGYLILLVVLLLPLLALFGLCWIALT
jgi:hypothetical protein